MSNLFTALFAADPDRPCLEVPFESRSLTYGELADLALRLGQTVLDQGVSPGERVVLQAEKSIEGLALWLGCVAAGVVFVPTNTAYTPDEITYYCQDAQASLLITDNPDKLAAVETRIVAVADLVAAAETASPVEIADVSSDDLNALLYTSGTTGRPKGAMLTHGCMLDNARALVEVWAYSGDDVLVHTLPIFHVHGLFVSLNPTLLSGAKTILLPKFDVDSVLDHLDGATVFMGVPTYYHRLLADDRFGPESCTTARLFTSGSAPMTEQMHAEFTARTGRQVVERYGMSESGIITSNRLDSVVPGSVGHALAGYELRVVDESWADVATGETGVVAVRGPSLGPGYWQLPDANAESRTEDGWFATGDVGFADETGRLTLEGRSSDMIISGGLNVYPKEIEMALDEIDGIAESAIVGVPHADFGEAVTAYLVLDPGVTRDDLAIDAGLSSLARFKHPKNIYVLDEMPRNTMGKVQKAELRKLNA